MPKYNSVAIIKTADNVEANYATNTWHFDADDLTALALCHAALATFYQALDAYMSNLVKTTDGLEVTSYAMADTKPRAPVLTSLTTLAPAGSAPLPTEVALCLSFQGVRSSGAIQSRRRGRVYLPFFDETSNFTDGRPASAFVTAVAGMGQTLLNASDSAGTWTWETYSTVEPGWVPVDNGWVDNEWDTQRRRGRPYTSRVTFS